MKTKRTKKLLIILLAIAMIFTLSACSGDSDKGDAGDSGSNTGDNPGGNAADPGASDVDPLTINFSSTYNQNETGGKIIQHFIDNLDALSGGKITVNITWGGTLFDAMAELDAVSDGAVNMVALGHMPHTGTLNYLGFPGFAPGGSQGAVDYFLDLMFENPETSKLIQEEAAANNIKYLNVIAGGANAICATFDFTDLASLVSGSAAFGNFAPAQWEALGFHVIPLTPPDVYDAFSRGQADATQMGFAPMVSLSWYEVAPYWALDGTYTAGNMFTVNLPWWEGLTAAQQELIQQAADEVAEYSTTIYDDAISADISKVEDATGNAFVIFDQSDLDKLWASCFEATAEGAMKNAAANGKEDGMKIVLEEAAKFTNYDWKG